MLERQLKDYFAKQSQKLKTLQFAIEVPAIPFKFVYSNTTPDQHFHSASVGKMLTATLIFIAIEQNKLSLDTDLFDILPSSQLEGLFVPTVNTEAEPVKIRHLLAHTSGVNDYFESKTITGARFIDEIIQDPNHLWSPEELIHYTRTKQKPVAPPGKKYFYSDTGYILLGQVVEHVFQLSFAQALEQLIFIPAGMKQTSLCFSSDNFSAEKLAPLYVNGTDVHLFNSLSCDQAGGGLSTTAEDLLLFLDAFQSEKLISGHSIGQMGQFDHRFRPGLHYGLGLMQTRFEAFFFLLKGLPRLQGHLGVTGVHAWYDPHTNLRIVLNVGNTKDVATSFKMLITVLQMIEKYQKASSKSGGQ